MTKNVSILGIGMALVGALFFLPIPYFSMVSLWFYLLFFIPYLFFTFFLDITGKVRNSKLKSYSGYIGLFLFAVSFAVPAIKQFHEQPFLQAVFIIIFIVINFIVYRKNTFFYSIVLPEGDKSRVPSMMFWGLFLLIIFAGGRHYMAPTYFALHFGQEMADVFYSVLFLLLSYLFSIFATSLTYKFIKGN